MKLTIGVMGSSGGDLNPEVRQKAYRLGGAIADQDAVLVTGGCPGLPYEAVRGAKARRGLVVGISPGLSIDEHRGKYASPVEGFDVLICPGSGLMRWLGTAARPPKRVFIVHGKPGPAAALATRIKSDLGWAATGAAYRDRFAIE